MPKKILSLVVLVVVVLLGLAAWLRHAQSYQTISVKLDTGVSGKLIRGGGEDPGQVATVANFTDSYSAKLKKDDYTLTLHGGTDYQPKTIPVSLDAMPVNLKVSLDYSTAKLAQLLSSELPAISQALDQKYPTTSTKYSISQGHLFKRGDWFGALMVPLGNSQDTLRVILNKNGGKWTVATKPPDIILNIFTYPDIPKEILQAVNSL